jgi:hypothetical protein
MNAKDNTATADARRGKEGSASFKGAPIPDDHK